MQTLTGKKIQLRALEPEDLEFVIEVENDEDFWELSATQTPFSRFIIKNYLKNAHRDIYEVKQLRLIIENFQRKRLGMIDLFDYNPKHNRAAIGIIIAARDDRRKGFGAEALRLICNYAFKQLNMHQVYANILEKNTTSQKLFEQEGFEQVGLKKDWNLNQGTYQNELFYQKLNHVH